jgi:WD40 repeat protein
MQTNEAWAAQLRADRHMGDFRRWTTRNQYRKSLERVLSLDEKSKYPFWKFTMARFFISHSSHDNDRAVQLRDWLLANGWDDIFLDLDPKRGIAAGERWKEALQRAAQRCEAVLALVSPAWLASDWCRPELNVAQLLSKKIFVILIGSKSSEIPADLKHEQFVDLINDPDGYVRLKEGLRRAGLDPATFPFEEGRVPYPGLAALEKDDAAIFFGRDAQIVRGIDRLRGITRTGVERMLFILGASGCGKSSFLRAGLWPRLNRDDRGWLPLSTIRPERAAISGKFGLVEALHNLVNRPAFVTLIDAAGLPLSRAGIEEALIARDEYLVELVSVLRQPWCSGEQDMQPTIVFCVDQGEELFNEDGGTEAKLFVKILCKTVLACKGVLALVTMRTDSYPIVQDNLDLAAVPKDTFALDRLVEGSYRAIIEGPAALVRPIPLAIDPQLTDALLKDVTGQDALALLAFTLRFLYDKYQQNNRLSFEAYDKLGRLKGVIETTVKQALRDGAASGEFSADEKEQIALIRDAFIPHLARANATGQFVRRVATLADIPSDARSIIRRFVEARLLIKDRRVVDEKEVEVIEVAHEALLREWKELNTALLEEREFLVAKAQLEQDLAEYRKTPADGQRGALLTENKLTRARSWLAHHPKGLTEEECAYIQASVEAEDQRARRRRHLQMATIAALVTVSTIIFALYIRSSQNLTLALLTKADQFLVEDNPNRARIVSAAVGASKFEEWLQKTGVFGAASTESIRTKTIAEIASSGGSRLLWTHKHQSAATTGAFAPDGSTFAIGYRSGEVLLVSRSDVGERGTSPFTWLKPHSTQVVNLKFSVDGNWLATASAKDIVIWSLRDKRAQTRLCLPNVTLNEVAFDPKGQFLAAVANDGVLRLWKVGSWQPLHEFRDHDDWSVGVQFDASGATVASVGNEGRVVIRNTSDWQNPRGFSTRRVDLISLAIAPNSRFLATAALGGAVDLWDLNSGGEPAGKELAIRPNRRWKLRYSPNGLLLAVASWDGTVRFFNSETLQPAGTIDGHDHWVNDLAFSPNSERLLTVSESGVGRVWDLRRLAPMFYEVKDDTRETLRGRYSPDGNWFVSGGRDKVARVYSVANDGRLQLTPCKIQHESWIYGLAISTRDTLVASSGTSDRLAENSIKVWRADTCEVKVSLPVGRAYVPGIDLSYDGSMLAWATSNGEIWVARINGEAPTQPIAKSSNITPNRVAFSPDASRLAVGYSSGAVKVWNLGAREVEAEVQAHQRPVSTLSFHPNGRWIASGGPEDRIVIWDRVRTGTEGIVQILSVPGGSNELAFNFDGTKLAVGSDARYIAVWDTGSWEKQFQLHARVGVRSVFGFHPQRGDLAFDGGDGRIHIVPKRLSTFDRKDLVGGSLKGVEVLFDDRPSDYSGSDKVADITDQMVCANPLPGH